jgi:uncharacterized protein (TIGR00730 family)
MHNETGRKPLTLPEMIDAAQKRVAFISEEFRMGFTFLLNYPRSVTFFGSTRTEPDHFYYKKAEKLAARIAKELHYSVITGGGPGIMEAANKGAFEAGGNSLGLAIELPNGQLINKYVTDKVSFYYFFSRKVCLAFCAEAYIFFPGGFGTLDELSEIITLVQTQKIRKIPIFLVGKEYWEPLLVFFKEKMLKENMIDEVDLSLFTVTDDEDQILEIIKNSPVEIDHGFDREKVIDTLAKNSEEVTTERPLSKFLKWM